MPTSPSSEQLRTLDVHALREQFSMGIQEAIRAKIEQRIKDGIYQHQDELTRRILLDMLFLITGRTS